MKEQIRKIKELNPSFGHKKIAKIVGCAPNTVKYHLTDEAKDANKKRILTWRNDFLKETKQACGGKCCVCYYDRDFAALDFHHVLPELKVVCKDGNLGVGNILRREGKDAFLREVDKCILVCSNCHREIHSGSILTIVT